MKKLILSDYPGNSKLASGKIVTFRVEMKPFNDHRMRTIRVWLPDDYDEKKRFPVIYMHDAQNLFAGRDCMEKWNVDRAFRNLTQEGLSLIIVGIDTSETRFSELCPSYPINRSFLTDQLMNNLSPAGAIYEQFIVSCLKPLIDQNFKTLKDTEFTGIGGSSMGGLISFDMIMNYPDVFGRALVFSPAFISFPVRDTISRLNSYDYSKLRNHRLYFYNGGQTLDAQLTMPMLRIYNKLISKGLTSEQIAMVTDSREPHFEASWCKFFPDAIRYLFVKDLPRHQTTFDPEALRNC